MAEPLFLRNTCAPGDVTVLSALTRDLHLCHPGRFDITYVGNCKTLFQNSPYVSRIMANPPQGKKVWNPQYMSALRAGQHNGKHFLTAFPEEFSRLTGIPVELQLPKGSLHLSEEEKQQRPMKGRYWMILPGRKSDFTTKLWSVARWQQLVDALAKFGIRCLQTGSTGKGHWNPTLSNVENQVGPSDLRKMLSDIYNADGVICSITSAMHMAACFDKPCVVIAGGREAWWWEAYVDSQLQSFGPTASGKVQVPHRYLHTQGLLDCCTGKGCWKNKVLKTEPDKHKSYCSRPVEDGYGQMIPECHSMIQVEHVIEAVMSYYKDGILPPIGPVPKIIMPDGTEFSKTETRTPQPIAKVVTPPASLPAPPPAPQPPTESKPEPTENPLDLSVIGGKFTVCILMYGNETDYHKTCLSSILSTLPAHRRDVRIGCNAVCDETLSYLSRLQHEGQITKVYVHKTNGKKYPVMREMFYDDEQPITTKYLCWFDDDTKVVDPQWAMKLAHTIIKYHFAGYRLYGQPLYWTFNSQQISWIKSRPWYRGREFQLRNGTPAPNGAGIQFAAGWFWAAEVKALKEAAAPDVQIGHNGGDYMIAEQLYQLGYKAKDWNRSKSFISTPPNGRRGLVEKHTGMTGWKPGGCV